MHGKSWVLIVNGISGGPILGKFGKLKNEYLQLISRNIFIVRANRHHKGKLNGG